MLTVEGCVFFKMKRTIGIICFIFIFLGISHAQGWPKIYSAIHAWGNYVIENYDKGYIILGTKQDYKYGWVIKTDINGNILWDKKIGDGQYIFAPKSIASTNDNGLIIAGTTTKYGNQQDAFILKLNSCGELDWCSDVYTPAISYDLGWRVKPTTDQGYVLLGEFNDLNQNLRTNLFKFDSEGSLLWHQSYLPDSLAFGDDALDVIVDSSGCLISATCYYPDPGQSGGWERFYLIRTDTAGNKLWSVIYGGNSYYHGFPSTSLRSKTGNFYSFGKHNIINSYNENPAIIKVLGDGTQSYCKDIFSNISSGGSGASLWLNDSTFIVACGWAVNMYYAQDVLAKTDTLGNLILSKNLLLTNGINSIYKAFDDKIISIATTCLNGNCEILVYKVNSDLEYDSIYTKPFTYDSLCPHPIVSDTINPDCNLVVNVEEPFTKPESHQMKVFPNPVKEKLTVVFPKYLLIDNPLGPIQSTTIYHQWKSTLLEVYDLSGKKVFAKEVPRSETELLLDVSAWQRGMYVFRLLYNRQEVGNQKVVVKE